LSRQVHQAWRLRATGSTPAAPGNLATGTVMASLLSGHVKQLLPECRHERVIAVASTLQQFGDRQRGDGLVAVEEPSQ
jgi:hypothetical protein